MRCAAITSRDRDARDRIDLNGPEPSVLPLRSDVAFAAGRREQILHSWQQTLERAQLCLSCHYRTAEKFATHRRR